MHENSSADTNKLPRRPRGRPANQGSDYADTRALLIQCGVVLLTEQGMGATTIDEVLRRVEVPKGSFYHYFESKQAFVMAVVDSYSSYFEHKLDRHFGNSALTPLNRLRAFTDDARSGIERFEYRRGCLVGNLGQEVTTIEESLRLCLEAIFCDWERRLARCLDAAIDAGELPVTADTAQLAHAFWIGWEGAVLRARVVRNSGPILAFVDLFYKALPRP